jgi:site-specific DNA recombinase
MSKKTTGKKRAAIYLRVSSASQVDTDFDPEGLSLPSQRERGKAYAARHGAEVIREYVEPGVSGGSILKREAFKRMLADIEKQRDVDLVIVWNVSRWARDEEDLWVAYGLLRRNGVELASVTEPIDDSPSGLLMLGVLGAIAAHDRRKLAIEVSRGRQQKAEVGGTPNRAPIGYLNVRTEIEGREIRTIAVDPERSPLIRLAFELYATGAYSLSDLAQVLEERGLRSRGNRRYATRPLNATRLNDVLRNDYYTGMVRNAGKTYKGRHPRLVSDSCFERVQRLLDTKRKSGERDRVHSCYLKGSLYCAECGGRLVFSRNKGNGGAYDYFICRAQQLGRCSQRYRSFDAIEQAVIGHYATIQLKPERREAIKRTIRRRFKELTALSGQELTRAQGELTRLMEEERKLLQAHYADSVSAELLAEEQQRIRAERAAAEETVTRLSGEYDVALANLDTALELTANIQAAYDLAPPHVRRLMNQAIFKKLIVLDERVVDYVLHEPFRQLLDDDFMGALEKAERIPDWQLEPGLVPTPVEAISPENERTTDLALVGGSINEALVGATGLEPATSGVTGATGKARKRLRFSYLKRNLRSWHTAPIHRK